MEIITTSSGIEGAVETALEVVADLGGMKTDKDGELCAFLIGGGALP